MSEPDFCCVVCLDAASSVIMLPCGRVYAAHVAFLGRMLAGSLCLVRRPPVRLRGLRSPCLRQASSALSCVPCRHHRHCDCEQLTW